MIIRMIISCTLYSVLDVHENKFMYIINNYNSQVFRILYLFNPYTTFIVECSLLNR